MTKPTCPECDESIQVSNARIGKKITCPNCREELEVFSLDPVELDYYYDEDDDYDDYDDDDDY